MEERIQYVPDHPTEIQLVSTHETKTICLGANFNPVSNDLITNSDNDLKILKKRLHGTEIVEKQRRPRHCYNRR